MTAKKHEEKKDLETDLHASAARVEELRAGRNLGDIPANDEYWKAVRNHQRAHHFKVPKNEE